MNVLDGYKTHQFNLLLVVKINYVVVDWVWRLLTSSLFYHMADFDRHSNGRMRVDNYVTLLLLLIVSQTH